jgi:hypothetical protein
MRALRMIVDNLKQARGESEVPRSDELERRERRDA